MVKSFTFELPYLLQNGPTCPIIIKPSDVTIEKLKLEKLQTPFIKIQALIDTGASTTAISHRVVNRLGLQSRGTTTVYTSNRHFEKRNEYDIALEFDVDSYISVLRVLEANLENLSIDCLIGRDVLQYGKFIYDGPKNQITLSF